MRDLRAAWLVVRGRIVVVAALAVSSVGVVVSPFAAHAAGPTPTAVYDSIGPSVPGNVPSEAFEATQTSEFGDLVGLGAGPRGLKSVTVEMSSWGCESVQAGLCHTTPGSKFASAITLNIYAVDSSGALPKPTGPPIVTKTSTFSIPFRPSASTGCGNAWSPDGGVTCYNGFATPISFSFDGSFTLPAQVIWTVAYNTTHYGYAPIGQGAACYSTGCGYDSLNVGLSTSLSAPTSGTDVDTDGVFVNSATAGNYCDGGVGGVGTLRDDTNSSTTCWGKDNSSGKPYRPMATIKTVGASTGSTASTVIVSTNTPNGWSFLSDNSGTTGSGLFVTGPGSPPVGRGSAQLTVTGMSDGWILGNTNYVGTRIDQLATLNYATFQPGPTLAPALAFDIKFRPTDTTYGGRLVFEPYMNVPTVNAGWQQWTAISGKWWASHNDDVSGSRGNCTQGAPCTLSQFLDDFPDATIAGRVVFKAGSNWTTFTGNVDDFTIGVDDLAGHTTETTYDFENRCTTACYVATTGDDTNSGLTPADPMKTIQAGVDQVSATGTVIVAAGTYVEDVALTKAVTLVGAADQASIISGPMNGARPQTVNITAAGVVVNGFTITREGNAAATWNNNLNTAGVAITGVAAEIENSRFTGNRTAINVTNGSGTSIHNNVVDGNRTGMFFWNTNDNVTVTQNQITNNFALGVLFNSSPPSTSTVNSTFSNNSIAGNWYGGVVDRTSATSVQDFSDNWFGTTTPVFTSADSAEPGYAALIPSTFVGGTATRPASAPDVLGPFSDHVDFTPSLEVGTDSSSAFGFQGTTTSVAVNSLGAQAGTVSRIQEGIATVSVNGTVDVRSGSYLTTTPISVPKSLSLRGPNAGISPNDATSPSTAAIRLPEATIAVTGSINGVSVGTPGVTVDGFDFTDTADAGSSSATTLIGAGSSYGGDASGVVVTNNVFDHISRTAVYFNGAPTMNGGKVDDNRVSSTTRATGCGTGTVASGSCGHQLFNMWQTDHVSFQRNVILGNAGNGDRVRVLNIDFPNGPSAQLPTDTATNITISSNTIVNSCTYTCFSINHGVTNTVIEHNNVSVDVGNIVDFGPTFASGTITIDHNVFAAMGGATVTNEASASDLSKVSVNRNAITGFGIAPQAGVTMGALDATCNWWGSSSGPAASQQNAASVNTTPALASADLDGVCGAPVGPGGASGGPAEGPATPVAVAPARLLDTRSGAMPAAGSITTIRVTGVHGVPADAQAVFLNVTATDATAPGFITVFAGGTTRPGTSNLNVDVADQTIPNMVVSPVGADGTVSVFVQSSTDLVVDVMGYIPVGVGYTPLVPARAIDTRGNVRPGDGSMTNVTVTNVVGAPTGATAVILNVTATNTTGAGFVTVFPTGTARPSTSNLNVDHPGQTRANLVIVPIGADGKVSLFTQTSTDLIVDVFGFFTPAANYNTVQPSQRLLDTRVAPAIEPAAGSTTSVKVAGVGSIPLDVKYVIVNVTSDAPMAPGFVTVHPGGTTLPLASNLNVDGPGTIAANLAFVPVGADGTVDLYTQNGGQLILDVFGWTE